MLVKNNIKDIHRYIRTSVMLTWDGYSYHDALVMLPALKLGVVTQDYLPICVCNRLATVYVIVIHLLVCREFACRSFTAHIIV